METLSFILGIAFVVVIVIAIIAVYAFVKVRKTENKIQYIQDLLSRELETTHRTINEEVTNLYQRCEQLERNIYSQMDSRFDKLENKLITKK